jgi:hypothetical protein
MPWGVLAQMDSNGPSADVAIDAIRRVSQVYDPIVVLRDHGEMVLVVRVGMKNTNRFMILSATGEPAWTHEPLGSLSDVGWALRAHGWHTASIEPVGDNQGPARTLARLMKERA